MPDTQALGRGLAERVCSGPSWKKSDSPYMQYGQKAALMEEPVKVKPASGLRCEVVSDFGRLQQLLPGWDQLWRGNLQAEIFQSAGWAAAWWRSFGHHYTLCTIAVFAGNELVGIVPLVKRDGVIRFLGTPEADYADIICTEAWAEPVLMAGLKTLLESVGDWTECCLEHLSDTSMMVRYGRKLPRELVSRLHFVPAGACQLIVRQDESDPIFDSLLSKNHTKRRRNKLQKSGTLSFRHLETGADIETHLPQFCRQHMRRFLATGRESLCANPEFQSFMKALIQELGPTKRVRFGVLEFNNRPLAWHFGFESNGKFMLYQHTFDLDASEFTPGELMLWNVLSYAKAQSVHEFDFGSGDELYKQRFTNSSRQTFTLFLEPQRLAGTVRGFVRTLQGRMQPVFERAKQAAKKRATMRAVRSARMWAKGTMAGAREARRNGEFSHFSLCRSKELLGSLLFGRKSFEVFPADALPCEGAAIEAGFEIVQARFGDLVEFAWQHSDALCPSDLGRIGKRLKNGDRAYVVTRNSRPVMICFSSRIAADGFTGLSGEIVVIDRYWNAAETTVRLENVFPLLVREENSPAFWGFEPGMFGNGIKNSGLRPKFRITSYKVFGRFEKQSVRVYAESAVTASIPAA
jgi:CelD/BcsL family acetyltransferase involved in cellulose biosynthesis